MGRFVFVVCGATSHIQTLNFSLQCLKKFTKNKILVVTDLSRNEAPILHDHIIDVQTPGEYTHHQASIYLKTSLHRIADPEEMSCYLDSDVIALNKEVDEIFSFKKGPVTFASDHTQLESFSPYAVQCGCADHHKQRVEELEQLIQKHNPYAEQISMNANFGTRKLYRYFMKIQSNPFSLAHFMLRYNMNKLFHRHKFREGGSFFYDPVTRTWQDEAEHVLFFHALNYSHKIRKANGFHYSRLRQNWLDEHNKSIYKLTCDHLLQCIDKKFNVKNIDRNWTHYNGGVFLFSKDSFAFLEAWHNKTMNIFKDPEWRVRDQGTLAATTWEFGLQHQPRLPEEYNFLADFNNPLIAYEKDKGFTKDNFKTGIKPSFIHVYHNFGNKNWDVWQGIENIIGETY